MSGEYELWWATFAAVRAEYSRTPEGPRKDELGEMLFAMQDHFDDKVR